MVRTDHLTAYLAEIDREVVGTATLLTMPKVTYDCAPTAFVEPVAVAHDHGARASRQPFSDES